DKPDVYELKTKQVNCYDEMYALWAKDRATDNINTSDGIVTSPTPQSVDSNSKVIENSRPHVYTEGEIYEELKCLGLEDRDLQLAYAFFLENPVKTRGLFGCPIQDRLIYLKATVGLGDSKDFDTRSLEKVSDITYVMTADMFTAAP
nr:hypothetical protein [Tanacetum cinerariifolium]